MQAVMMKAEQAQDMLHKAVGRMQDLGAEFSDARSQTVRVTGVSSMNGDIRQLVQKSTGGVCLRAWVGGRWGYGTATTFDGDAVMRAAEQAVRNASGERKSDLSLEPATVMEHRRAQVRIHPDSVDLSEKIAAAQDLDRAQMTDERIVNSVGSYSEEVKTNALVNSAGSDLSWEEVRTLCRAMSVAADGQRMERYYDGPDSTRGFEIVRDADLEELGRVTAREAIETLKADRAPSGNLTVISDPMVSGLLAHEAMGHASEGDEITKRRSFLTGAVGRKVASDIISMYDTCISLYILLCFSTSSQPWYHRIPFTVKGTIGATMPLKSMTGTLEGTSGAVSPSRNEISMSGNRVSNVSRSIHALTGLPPKYDMTKPTGTSRTSFNNDAK